RACSRCGVRRLVFSGRPKPASYSAIPAKAGIYDANVRVIGLALGVVLAFASSSAIGGTGGQTVGVAACSAGEFLTLSYVHFGPVAEPSRVDQLTAAEPEDWQAILESAGETSLGRYGADTNWMLLRSALHQAAETLPHPSFVLFMGDFLAHNFRRAFDA